MYACIIEEIILCVCIIEEIILYVCIYVCMYSRGDNFV